MDREPEAACAGTACSLEGRTATPAVVLFPLESCGLPPTVRDLTPACEVSSRGRDRVCHSWRSGLLPLPPDWRRPYLQSHRGDNTEVLLLHELGRLSQVVGFYFAGALRRRSLRRPAQDKHAGFGRVCLPVAAVPAAPPPRRASSRRDPLTDAPAINKGMRPRQLCVTRYGTGGDVADAASRTAVGHNELAARRCSAKRPSSMMLLATFTSPARACPSS